MKDGKKKKEENKTFSDEFYTSEETPKDMLDLESEESGEQEETKMNTKSNA